VAEVLPWPMRILGAAFLTGGLWMSSRALLTGQGLGEMPPVLLFLAGPIFISVGLLMMDAQALLGSRAPALNWQAFWGGLAFVFVGLFLMAVSCADPRDEAFHAPRWVVAVVGLLFALGGVLALRTAPPKYREGGPPTKTGAVLVVLALTCAGTVFSYAAFGPGEREFEGTIAVPCFAVPFQPGEYAGRAVFGLAALVIDAFAIAGWYGLIWGTWLAFKSRRRGKANP
jgi:hypothetical protein